MGRERTDGRDAGAIAGLVLAAGAGTRMGRPKALVRAGDGTPWVELAVSRLAASGCDPVLVVLGAEAEAARALVPVGATVVVAEEWRDGVSASLRAGLLALIDDANGAVDTIDAVVITLVDLPDAGTAPIARLIDRSSATEDATTDRRRSLAQAAYDGRPGHPVVVGREHWSALARAVSGDRGARPYLAEHGGLLVECGDLERGEDVDV